MVVAIALVFSVLIASAFVAFVCTEKFEDVVELNGQQ